MKKLKTFKGSGCYTSCVCVCVCVCTRARMCDHLQENSHQSSGEKCGMQIELKCMLLIN